MSVQSTPLIEIKELDKAYQTGDGPFQALTNVNLAIYPGEFLGITGKSGAGKTTLLNMISGVSPLTRGEILFNRDNVSLALHEQDENNLAVWRGENLGIVYQSFELIPSINLVENVMLPPDFLGQYNPKITKARALELLELVDIAEHAYKIPAHISGGQKQRVAIARALVNDPDIILADEPTGNLDSVTAETILQIFEKLVARGKTVVMVTHDQTLVPRFTRHIRISDGVLTRPAEAAGNLAAALQEQQDKEFQPLRRPGSLRTTAGNGTKGELAAVSLKAVNKTYENAAGKFVALKSIDLELEFGQFISVVGKSGSGKSTLLNMITGIDHPTSGEVVVGGKQIYTLSESQRARWRGKNMGIVFQFFQLLPTLTLLENTILPMDYCNIYAFNDRPKKAMELLELVGLGEHAHKLPGSVSSGQQQSAAIARSIATDPQIILADEPTGNLDSASAEGVLDLFAELARQGKTVIIVTHDPAITQRTDQTIILSDGEIIDPVIAVSLPFLTHPKMLEATHQMKKRRYQPAETILNPGDVVEHFYMINAGKIEVFGKNELGYEVLLATLGPGDHFGEVELLRNGGRSIAGVRAARGEQVEIALLEKQDFIAHLGQSHSSQASLDEIITKRLAENRDRLRRD
jgi:ABC-type lipoprotein export system ATPase subunit